MASERLKRVYVVDDEQVIATTLGLIFRNAGFEAQSYFDPLELLAACKSGVPDAVISDVMMPHMNGIDLAMKLGELYPQCRVVLMSGQAATSELVQDATRKGHVVNVLAKPVLPTVLIEHVRNALT